MTTKIASGNEVKTDFARDARSVRAVRDAVQKTMRDSQGNSKGYFTLNDWKTILMTRPVQDALCCDEAQAEQTFQQLLQEGRIRETEEGEPGSGKYEPTESRNPTR
jgi:hypothetical protein